MDEIINLGKKRSVTDKSAGLEGGSSKILLGYKGINNEYLKPDNLYTKMASYLAEAKNILAGPYYKRATRLICNISEELVKQPGSLNPKAESEIGQIKIILALALAEAENADSLGRGEPARVRALRQVDLALKNIEKAVSDSKAWQDAYELDRSVTPWE